jgi:hypothetical protein
MREVERLALPALASGAVCGMGSVPIISPLSLLSGSDAIDAARPAISIIYASVETRAFPKLIPIPPFSE